MKLERVFYLSSNLATIDKGVQIPPWNGNYNRENWWGSPLDEQYYFYSMSGNETYIQYGYNNPDWAAARFFGESVEIISETQQDDGSITAKVKVTPNFFTGRKSQYASPVGFRVNYTIKINNVVVYTFSGQSIDIFTYGVSTSQTFDINVKPNQTESRTALEIAINYPNGEVPNSTTVTGVGLFNPNPPTYIPMAIRTGGTWTSLNKNKGYINKRKGGVWTDCGKENTSTQLQANKGQNQIRQDGTWKQLPLMK